MSFGVRFKSSLRRSPAEYIREIIHRCFRLGNCAKIAFSFLTRLNTSGNALYSFARAIPPLILPPAFPHFLVIELDSIDTHILLGGGYMFFLYHMEHIAVDVLDRQQVKVMPLVVFHEVAEIDFIGFYGGKAVPLLFQQFQVAFRQCVFPLGLGCRT